MKKTSLGKMFYRKWITNIPCNISRAWVKKETFSPTGPKPVLKIDVLNLKPQFGGQTGPGRFPGPDLSRTSRLRRSHHRIRYPENK